MEIISKSYLFLSVEMYQNIFPCKVQLLTTMKTKPQVIGNKYLPDYPLVDEHYVVESGEFVDSVRMHNSYLFAIGGDYDG